MSSVSRLHWGTVLSASIVQIINALIDKLDMYRRYISAGRDIEALLSLSDQQLAARQMTRTEVGGAIFAKHGIPYS